jgi:predicted nucleotidyltransferase
MPAPREEMRIVATRLQPLEVPFAFVGGAVMCLLVDHPELTDFRRTKDVDVVVAAVTYTQFAALEERLRKAHFKHDPSKGAPICRWVVDDCKVDIMPEEPANLGMNTKWFPEVLRLAMIADLGEGCSARVVTPPLFLATKLEAFRDRGKEDYFASHDLEDIVTLVEGRSAIVDEVASVTTEAGRFVSVEFAKIVEHPDFNDALLGHLSPLFGARERAPLVLGRFQAIAKLHDKWL